MWALPASPIAALAQLAASPGLIARLMPAVPLVLLTGLTPVAPLVLLTGLKAGPWVLVNGLTPMVSSGSMLMVRAGRRLTTRPALQPKAAPRFLWPAQCAARGESDPE